MKSFAIAVTLLVVTPAAAAVSGDGWAHDLKPPPPEKIFKTPYDVLIYTNQDISGGDPRTVTIKSDGNGNVAIDLLYPLSRQTNPAISLMQDHYVLHGDSTRGWTVADLRAGWKCRYGDTQSWQWQRASCLVRDR